MSPPAALSASVLGPARLVVAGGEPPPELLWRKHLALLVYLARSPRRGRTREHLIGLLWADRNDKQARHSLSEALRVLRRALGDHRVQADVDQIRLADDAVALDCDELVRRRDQGDWAGAAELVAGEFLEGLAVPGASEFETWLAAERASWRAQGVDALVRWSGQQLAGGDAGAAAATAQRALALDPAAESATCAAMRALALAGDRAGALRVFAATTTALAEQLGTRPAPETARLAERVRDARISGHPVQAPPGARPRAPLVARAAELAALLACWERARGNRGQVILIEAEPGEGKTRLLDELVSRALLDGATVVAARAVPADEAQPWSGVAGWLASGLAEAPGVVAAPAAALAALGALHPDLAARGPSAGAPLPLPLPDALRAVMTAAAQERAVLLALDDAQWLDAATVASLAGLARDIATRPVALVLGVTRGAPGAARFDDLRARIGRDVEGAAVHPGRFDDAALRALVGWALPAYDAEEADRLVRRLARDSAGIPLLAVAIVDAVAQGLRLAADAPAWPTPARTLVDSLPGDLPPAAIGAICLRYRGLDPAAQQVLAAAAALGGRVEVPALARATSLDGAGVQVALDALEWAGWLCSDARGYTFTAPIARAVLLQEMLTPGQVRRLRSPLET